MSIEMDEARVEALVKAKAARAARLGAEMLLSYAMPLVPFRTGKLRSSGHASDDGHGTAAVAFSTVYAARQHEETSYRHNIGQAKYLSDPAESRAAEIAEIVAQAMRGDVS